MTTRTFQEGQRCAARQSQCVVGVPSGELVGDMASKGSGGLCEELTGEGGSLYVSCVSVWTWGLKEPSDKAWRRERAWGISPRN